jgi:predicted kinase
MQKQIFLQNFVKPGQCLILRGIPGSGKSSLVTAIKEKFGYKVKAYSADDLRTKDTGYEYNPEDNQTVHQDLFNEFCTGVRYPGNNIYVVDNCNARLWHMSPYLALAQSTGLKPFVVTLESPNIEEAAKRNAHGVPLVAIEQIAARMETLPPFWPQVFLEK